MSIPVSITVCSFPSSLYRQPHHVINLGKLETSFLKLLRSGVGLITDSLTVHPGWVHCETVCNKLLVKIETCF